jgi:diguanylate cyclase (GGDEF)-like protein
MRILIADDDVTSRVALAGVLAKFGLEVLATVDGLEAWEAMRGPDAPALAILDWMMPGLDGVEVCRRVRSMASDQPPYLILLTSRGDKADIVAGLEAGADDYLAKPFDPGELRARVDVGRRVVALQARLMEANAALAFEATHDPLTGTLNRRAFAEVLSRELADERRFHHGLALGICDVDQFKRINDTYGHQVGDEVLFGLVRLMEAQMRGHDALGRHGGDEFVVLATRVTNDDVRALFDRLRRGVAERAFPTTVGELSITISFGVSVFVDGASGDGLLAAADAALYQSKSGGRDRVCVADAQTT